MRQSKAAFSAADGKSRHRLNLAIRQMGTMTKAVAGMLTFMLAFSLMPATSLGTFSAFAQDETDAATDQTATDAGAVEEAPAADDATVPAAIEESAPAVEDDTTDTNNPDATAIDSDGTADGSTTDAVADDPDAQGTDEDKAKKDEDETHPAQELTATVAGTDITVRIEAAEGVLPKDATVEAEAISNENVIGAVVDVVESNGVQAGEVKALDIVLRDAADNEVQPKGKVTVTFSKTDMKSDSVSIYRVVSPDNDEAQTLDASRLSVEEVQTLESEADEQIFESDRLAAYAIVGTDAQASIEEEEVLGDNPDHLAAPDESPYAGEIDYGVPPETEFPALAVSQRQLVRSDRANGLLTKSRQLAPGEVRLSKTATPVQGMVNTWDVTLRVEGRDKPVTSDIVLVIDTSGSMGDRGRMTAAKNAANEFVETLLASGSPSATTTRIGVVNFDSSASVRSGLTNNTTALHTAINNLSADGGTFTQAGVKQAEAMLASSIADHKHIVLLSDGVPTYSYALSNPDNYLIYYPGYGRQTGTGAPASAYRYSNRVGDGSDIRWRYHNGSGIVNDKYYNHGNSAIAEAGFAKNVAGNRMWSIALEVDAVGQGVLQQMASSNSYYTATPADLAAVFNDVAGQICAAVQNAAVNDPMGPGFQIPAASVSSITTVPATPAASYDPGAKTITWNPGTLTTPIAPGSDIKYAELIYRIEINDDILGQTPDANGEYPTNGDTQISYADADGNSQTGTFPVPTVNPVLYKLTKVLKDKTGAVVTADRDFTIEVMGPGVDGDAIVRSFTLNTSTSSSTKLMTDLRYARTYTFEETGTNVGQLTDYNVRYFVNGAEVSGADRKFDIVDGSTEDVEVRVENTEIPKLTLKKVITGSQADMTKNFEFTVTVTRGSETIVAERTVTLSHNEDVEIAADSGKTLLPGDQVTITEDSYPGYVTTYTVNSDDPQNGSQAEFDLSGDTTVTFTNTSEDIPPTGVLSPVGGSALPLVVVVGILLAAAAVAITRRREVYDSVSDMVWNRSHSARHAR